jgi:pimeloyl-ACP methyl ester carboxylesterase
MSEASIRLALLPGFMLDDALWNDLIPLLPGSWHVQPIALPRGRTVNEVAAGVASRLSEPTVVLGFSMGGYVARALAVSYPKLVKALVLVATSARETPQDAASLNVATPVVFKGLSRKAVQRSLGPTHAEDGALIDRVRAMSARLGPEQYAWQSAVDRVGTPLRDIRCPTLVVAAGQDQLRSIEESEELVREIPGAVLKVMEGSGHLVPLEDPRALADMLTKWVCTMKQSDPAPLGHVTWR